MPHIDNQIGKSIGYITDQPFVWVREYPFFTPVDEGDPTTWLYLTKDPNGNPVKLWRYQFFRIEDKQDQIDSDSGHRYIKVTFWNHPHGYVYHKYIWIGGPDEYYDDPTSCIYGCEGIKKWIYLTNALKNVSGDTKYVYDRPEGNHINNIPANWIVQSSTGPIYCHPDSTGWFRVDRTTGGWNNDLAIGTPGWVWAGITRDKQNYDFKSYQHVNHTCGY